MSTTIEKIAITLQDGEIIIVDEIQPYSYGFNLKNNEGWEMVCDSKNIKEILPIDQQGQIQFEHIEEAKLGNALLTLEQLWLEHYNKKQINSNEIIIFGSTSLSLTIAPKRISHDIDAIIEKRDINQIAKEWEIRKNLQPELLDLDACDPELLRYLGRWESRALTIKKTESYKVKIPHPLDTLSQKLLRQNENNFQKKDLPDIANIIQALNPTEETLLQLLQEGYERFFSPIQEIKTSAWRNTETFLKIYLPEKSLERDIIEPARKTHKESLRTFITSNLKVPIRTLPWAGIKKD
jgi:hypothetical protein